MFPVVFWHVVLFYVMLCGAARVFIFYITFKPVLFFVFLLLILIRFFILEIGE